MRRLDLVRVRVGVGVRVRVGVRVHSQRRRSHSTHGHSRQDSATWDAAPSSTRGHGWAPSSLASSARSVESPRAARHAGAQARRRAGAPRGGGAGAERGRCWSGRVLFFVFAFLAMLPHGLEKFLPQSGQAKASGCACSCMWYSRCFCTLNACGRGSPKWGGARSGRRGTLGSGGWVA